jgi:hypothetical protein
MHGRFVNVVTYGHTRMVTRARLTVRQLVITRHGKFRLVCGLGKVEADVICGSDAPKETPLTLPHNFGNPVFALLGDRPVLCLAIRPVEVTIGAFDEVTITGQEDVFRNALGVSAANAEGYEVCRC